MPEEPRRRTRRVAGTIAAIALMAGLIGCGSAVSSGVPSTVPSAVPSSLQAAQSPTTSSPSPTIAPPSSAMPSPSPSAACGVTADMAAVPVGKPVHFSGTGFMPGSNITVTFDGPTLDMFTFPPADSLSHPKLLRVAKDSTFGPWDVTFEKEDAGDWAMSFTDGTCTGVVTFSVSP